MKNFTLRSINMLSLNLKKHVREKMLLCVLLALSFIGHSQSGSMQCPEAYLDAPSLEFALDTANTGGALYIGESQCSDMLFDDSEVIQIDECTSQFTRTFFVYEESEEFGIFCSDELGPECTQVITIIDANCGGTSCDLCPGDETAPVITCGANVSVTWEEYEQSLTPAPVSEFGTFFSEYQPADLSLGNQALVPEGVWAVTDNAQQYHNDFQNCSDADGSVTGEMLVFNGNSVAGVSVYCQNVDVIAGVTYSMSVQVVSVHPSNPAEIQFAVNGTEIGNIHTASPSTCVWTELAATWIATSSESVTICILNQNTALQGNDFAIDNFIISDENGNEIENLIEQATATDECEYELTFLDVESFDGCVTTITRTWTAVDACDNTSSCDQLIIITDTESVIEGCMDSTASNFNPEATCSDDSCVFTPECTECPGDETAPTIVQPAIDYTANCDEDQDSQLQAWLAGNGGFVGEPDCPDPNFFWSNAPTVNSGDNTATGTINGIGYTYSSDQLVETEPIIQAVSNFPAEYGIVDQTSIMNTLVSSNTISFDAPLLNPVLAFASIGNLSETVGITFGVPGTVVWSQDVSIVSSTEINGTEGFAIVRFEGEFTEISFEYLTEEFRANFLFGADFTEPCVDVTTGGTAVDDCGEVVWSNDFIELSELCEEGKLVNFTATDACGNASTTSATFTCNVSGCTDPLALNFDSLAGCSDDSCEYDGCIGGPCAGDVTSPEIECSEDLVITQEEFDNLVIDYSVNNPGNGGGSGTGGADFPFESDYIQGTLDNVSYNNDGADIVLNEGYWVVTDNATDWHYLFTDCPDSDGNDDGSMMVFNGAQTPGVSVLCQSLDVIGGEEYSMSIEVASLIAGNPAQLKFTANGVDISIIQTANLNTCDWSTFDGTWIADITGSVDFCVVNENTIAGGNDFAIDNYSVQNSDGDEISENGSFDEGSFVVPAPLVTDNCDEDVELTFVDVETPDGCDMNIERTWTATDDCGNLISCVQNITVTQPSGCMDTEACNFDPSATCDDGSCQGIPDGDCDCDGNIVDECGNCGGTAVAGCTDPNALNYDSLAGCSDNSCTYCELLFECPIDANFECLEDIPVANIADVVILESCGDVIITWTDSGSGDGCDTPFTVTRVYTLTDDNNTLTCEVTYTAQDTTPPVFDPMEIYITAECGELDIEQLGITATDNCGNVTITYQDVQFSPGCLGTYQRTYTATDECGNTAQAVQLINLTNENGPMIECPEDESYECLANVPEAVEPEVSHGCNIEIVSVDLTETMEGTDCSMTITRLWTATDACGGVSTCTQTIIVIDTVNPVIICPEDIAIECGQALEFDEATASDNCGEANISSVDTEDIGACTSTYTRTWTATDNCGNSSSCSQTITVTDTTNPTIEVEPVDLVLECDEEDLGFEPDWSDNCDEQLEFSAISGIVILECGYQIERSWTATDNCGNTTTVSQTVTFVDSTDPIAMVEPEDVNVECGEEAPEFIYEFSDNCDEELEISSQSSTGVLDCGYWVEETYIATDDCGNSVSVSRTITYVDTTDPTIEEEPENLTLECDEEDPGFEPVWSDNCDEELELSTISGIVNLDCGYQIERSWTATDDCGNTTTVSQVVTFVDNSAPVITVLPVNLSLECDEEDPGFEPIWLDNCDEELEFTAISGIVNLECGYQIERSWTATDDCGNSTTVTQIVTFQDTTDPVLETPADLEYECDEVGPFGEASVTDNCDEDVEIVIEEDEVINDCGYQIIRTFTAVDNCGNTSTATQTITVTDTTSPTIEEEPENMTLECDQVAPEFNPIWSDNCDEQLELSAISGIVNLECGYQIERSWTATDDCGNSTTVSQIVTFIDTSAPVVLVQPENITLECDQQDSGFEPDWLDNCDEQLELSAISGIVNLECGHQIQRSWTATDDCGNSTTIYQTVTFEDTTVPVFTNVPDNSSVECYDDVPELVDLTATDNCDIPVVNCVETEDLDDCGNGTITVTCTATDNCGNSTVNTYVITIADTTPPELVGDVEDLVLDCEDELPAPPLVEVIDNCDDNPELFYNEVIIGELPEEGSVNNCALQTPEIPTCQVDNWSLVLFHDTPLYFSNIEGSFVEYDDGTAHLTGTVSAIGDVNSGFTYDVWFENGMDWNEWSTQVFPTFYKDDCGSAAITLEYENWMYYIFTAGAADLTGYGSYAGSSLELSHAPVNYFFGYQVGVGANNVNGNYGNGGWFIAQGNLFVDGVETIETDLTGDFAFDADCCPQYEVERTWYAEDCSGNVSEILTQNISFELLDDDDEEIPFFFNKNDGEIFISSVTPNPAIDYTAISFEVRSDMDIVIDVVDMNGVVLKEVYNGSVSKNMKYRREIQTSVWSPGLYVIRITSNLDMKLAKFIVQK